MKAIKKILGVIGTVIRCSLLLAIFGIAVLVLSMHFGFKTILILDGAFVAFLIVKKIIKKATRKTETA